MKTYKVLASFVSYSEIEIEAESDEQANDIAHNLDGGSFKHSGYGDWNIDAVVEIQQ